MARTSDKQQKLNSIRETIEQIAKDQVDPKTLSVEDRRLCVEFLRYEMRYAVRQIARILKTSEGIVNADLRVVNIGMAKAMQHGEIGAELVGQLIAQLRANYDMALEKRDVSGANKTTEMLKELAQDLGHVQRAGDAQNSKALDILALAIGAGGKKKSDA
jgi:hypothetical protein